MTPTRAERALYRCALWRAPAKRAEAELDHNNATQLADDLAREREDETAAARHLEQVDELSGRVAERTQELAKLTAELGKAREDSQVLAKALTGVRFELDRLVGFGDRSVVSILDDIRRIARSIPGEAAQ